MLLRSRIFAHCVYASASLLLLSFLFQLAYAHGMSEADKLAIIEGGNLRYLWLGATHMLTGYDHLAFVFGIIFFLSSFKDIVKYVTAFTLGHSVTLIYATFNSVQLNYFVIDAIIGLSVCYIAFANIDGFRKYLKINPPNMMLMIVVLGLIHGFGLSTRLQELPLSEDQLLLNIISFNAGIELGQISALALMLLLMTIWRKSHAFQSFSLIANYGLILLGGFLFLMQAHGYVHNSDSEALIISQGVEDNVVSDHKISNKENAESSLWQDVITVTIPAHDGKEYKFYLQKAAMLEYAWATNGGNLYFDFHGEPEGDITGYFKSYLESTQNQASGSLVAPFEGVHGWYWENGTAAPIVVTLKTRGAYQRLDLENIAEPVASSSDHKTIY